MTTGTQQLRDFSDWLDRQYPASVSMGVRAAADYIDAQEAEIGRLRNALELFLAHSPEPECAIWRHVHAVARAALSGESNAK